MNILLNWLINAFVVFAVAYMLPGVYVESYLTALVVALILGILNILIKPVLIVLTLPITLLTFGFFLIIINALLLMLTDALLPGFAIESFWWAVFYSILVSVINVLLQRYKDEVALETHRRLK